MAIKNKRELENALAAIMKETLGDTSNFVKDLVTDFIAEWYDDYTPKQYMRTEQFLRSCTTSAVERKGNKLTVKIYIDTNSMSHNTPSYISEGDILTAAESGLHGAITGHYESGDSGKGFWKESVEYIKENKSIAKAFADYLNGRGFNVTLK